MNMFKTTISRESKVISVEIHTANGSYSYNDYTDQIAHYIIAEDAEDAARQTKTAIRNKVFEWPEKGGEE